MADAVPRANNALSTPPDELAELRAKKQRQLATSSAAPPSDPTARVPTIEGHVPTEPPARLAQPAVSDPTPEHMPTTAERLTPTTKPRRARAASPRPDRDGQVMISGYFPAETRRRLKIVAVRQDKTLQQVMADAFEAWLRRHDKDG